MSLRSVALALCLVGVVGGCASTAVEPTASAFTDLVNSYLGGADAASYAPEQVRILEQARAQGALEFEDYAQAIDASLQCIKDAGIAAGRDSVDDSRGFPVISYHFAGPTEGNPVADACILANSGAVEAIYQLQPASVEAANAHLASIAGDLQQCLAERGVDVDLVGLEGEELRNAVTRVINSLMAAGDPEASAFECLLILS